MANDDRVFFGVTVSKRRAEYLYKCLYRSLCPDCDREMDQCDADPCIERRVADGELAYCATCKETFDPTGMIGYQCQECYNKLLES